MATSCRSASDVGRQRTHNEDAYLVDEALQLFVVADGMGGHASGEVASGLAVQAFRDFVEDRRDIVWGFRDASPSVTAPMVRRLLEDALHAACREVHRKAQESPEMRGMGTTLVALLVAGARAFVAHVGDSRAYLVRDDAAVQLTRDHSVLNELVRRGEITEAEAAQRYDAYRHSLARAVGVCADVEVDAADFEVVPGDVFLLASDGLTQYVTAEELPALVDTLDEDLADALVALANDRGGGDNITAVTVRVRSDPRDGGDDTERSREFAAKLAAFRTLPMFRHFEYAELIRVLGTTEVAEHRAGEVILREGEPGDCMYVVLAGRVALDAKGARLSEVAAGGHFGELSLLDREPRSATATALEPTRLLRLTRDHLFTLVRREPEIAVKLLWSVSETLGTRLRATTTAYAGLRGLADDSAFGAG